MVYNSLLGSRSVETFQISILDPVSLFPAFHSSKDLPPLFHLEASATWPLSWLGAPAPRGGRGGGPVRSRECLRLGYPTVLVGFGSIFFSCLDREKIVPHAGDLKRTWNQ